MVCDIHMQVEVRRDGKWERVVKLPARPCPDCNGAGIVGERACYWCKATPGQICTPYHDRNYTVFSVLAGVRNDGYVTPIAEPRGLPVDAVRSPPAPDEDGYDASAHEYGDHSFSWLTLDEVKAYPWSEEIRDEGWVDAKTFAAWDAAGAKGIPSNWSGGVGGGRVEHVTNSRMREYIAAGMKEHPLIARIAGGERSFYTLIQWSVGVSDYATRFLAFVDSLAPLGDPSDVRLVFGFDS